MPNQPKTQTRTIRIDDTLWKDAQAVAAQRGETVSDAVRRSLKAYVRRHREEQGT